jgi:hypothetical protein
MAVIRIHSRLRHFNLLTRLTRVSMAGMDAIADFYGASTYCGLEAMAQLAALHVRHSTHFQCHAFLLKVHHCRWLPPGALQGRYRLTAERHSQCSNAFDYRVKALGPAGVRLDADLLIGTRPYDDEFREDILQAHYRDVFSGLSPMLGLGL